MTGPGSQWNTVGNRARNPGSEAVVRSLLVAPTNYGTMNHSWIVAGAGPLFDIQGGNNVLWLSGLSSPYIMSPVYYAHYSIGREWPGPGSSHPNGAQFLMADGSVKFINKSIPTGGPQPGVAGSYQGEPFGRYGNIWSGMHYYQGYPGVKTTGTVIQ